MQIVDVIQGTDEWKAARAGKVTASCIPAVMAKPTSKGEMATTRSNYLAQIVAERLSGTPCGSTFVSQEMKDGTEREPDARAKYENRCEVLVDQVGLVLHPTIANYAASPDGLIGEDGGSEIKCPKIATHIRWVLDDVVPEEHKLQMFANMDCAERPWWDFISYCPFMPPNLQLFIKRLMRDDKRIAAIRDAVEQFNREVDELIRRLQPF